MCRQLFIEKHWNELLRLCTWAIHSHKVITMMFTIRKGCNYSEKCSYNKYIKTRARKTII